MENSLEKVLRLKIEDAAIFSRIMQAFSSLEGFEATPVSRKTINDIYYDTENKDLFSAGFEYCIREEATGCSAILNQRNLKKQINFIQEKQQTSIEIEGPAANRASIKARFEDDTLEKIVGESELVPIFCSSFSREKMNLLNKDETWIEINGDQGEISINNVKMPLLQLQLKLKSGNTVELLKLAAVIIQKFGLMIDAKSKYDHGLELLGINMEEMYPKEQLRIRPRDNIADMAQKILAFGINDVFSTYVFFLMHPEEPESTHQIRVRIRKLRAILAFFMPLCNPKKYQQQQEKLRKTGLMFSDLRQLDVLLEEIEKMEQDSVIPVATLSCLTMRLADNRQKALAELSAYLQHNDITLMVLELWIWLLNEPWSESELLALSIEKYIKKALNTWQKKINKGIKKIDMEDKENIHKVRIRSKKLRYIMELLSPLLGKKSSRSIGKYEKLQDDLGYFHDVYVNKELLEQILAQSDEKQLHYEAGMVVGWQTLQGNLKMEKYLQ